jgi:hypothetical protein
MQSHSGLLEWLVCRRSGFSLLLSSPLSRFVFDIFFARRLQDPLTTTS